MTHKRNRSLTIASWPLRGIGLATALVLPCLLAVPSRAVYTLVYEWPPSLEATPEKAHEIAGAIDQKLGELNVEYAQKRASGRLGPLELLSVNPGTGEAYKKHCLDAGQREGQFKTVALQYQDDCSFHFERFRSVNT